MMPLPQPNMMIVGEWFSRDDLLAYGRAVAEAKDAEVAALRADLVAIAAIAHDGGLRGLSEHQALVSVRRLTLPHWDSTGCEKQHIVRLDAALAKEAVGTPDDGNISGVSGPLPERGWD